MNAKWQLSTIICTMWKCTVAKSNLMELTRVEREKITDSMHKIQSARAVLEDIDESKIPEFDEMQDCHEDADKNLRIALRSTPAKAPGKPIT
jgi:hypothetical protein